MSKSRIPKFSGLLLSAVFILFISDSCIKGPRCWGEDKNEGLIKEVLDMPCGINDVDGEAVFRNEKEYKAAFDSTCTPPVIDFSEFTLLFKQSTGGCYSKHKRSVENIDGEKRVHFKIETKNCGACKRLGIYVHWVLIPKIPDDFTVSFELKD